MSNKKAIRKGMAFGFLFKLITRQLFSFRDTLYTLGQIRIPSQSVFPLYCKPDNMDCALRLERQASMAD